MKEHFDGAVLGAATDPTDSEGFEPLQKNAIALHYFEHHRGLEPNLAYRKISKTFGSLHRDTLEATMVRRVPRFNINRRLEDNGVRL